MNYDVLVAELRDDPLGRQYSALTNTNAAANLNALTRTKLIAVPSRSLLAWAAAGARLAKIEDASVDVNYPREVRSVCRAAVLLVTRADTSLDLADASHVALVDALVASGVLSSDDRSSLYSLASAPTSRASELGLPLVGAGHVASARVLMGN